MTLLFVICFNLGLVKHHLELVFQKDPEAANDFDSEK